MKKFLITFMCVVMVVAMMPAIACAATVEVADFSSLKTAISNAGVGDEIKLTADIDCGSTQLAIDKQITLNLNGKKITTSFGWGGISLKGNCSLINGSILHKGGVAAIKVWNAERLEDLNITVEKDNAGNISVQSSAPYVGTIKNVTLSGGSYGIETQYVQGEKTGTKDPVIGTIENVTIKDTKQNGLILMAPVGTVKNCDISTDGIGINMFRKGLATVTATVENCDIKGETAVYLHDENFINPDYKNEGDLKLTIDEESSLTSADGNTGAKSEVGETGTVAVEIKAEGGKCALTQADGSVLYVEDHTFGTEVKFDGENHWVECACGEKNAVAAHNFEWVVDKEATETEKGSKHEECTACDYAKDPVEIPVITSDDSDLDEDKDDIQKDEEKEPVDKDDKEQKEEDKKDVPKTSDFSDMLPWIAMMAVTALAAVAFKKKEN